ncbi:NAD(P)/FAD-dependent oxidoreductase [Streptomyces sp. Lzd4kr]|nr:NAD(P)/FAD-dependent oxidoreductase [Streptomyces sp. Lzd4kr]
MTEHLSESYDVVVVGGGAAGLSAALVLARAQRSVLVVDAGAPRNASSPGVHGLLGQDGISPVELVTRGRMEVRRYGGQLVAGEVAAATRDRAGFSVSLVDDRSTHARQLLVATGLVDKLPDVPGISDRWGRDVLHCPYCHGWEFRGQAIGVLACGPSSVHQALLFRQLTDDIVYFAHSMPPPSGDEAEQLSARDIRVVTGEVASLELHDNRLVGVRLGNGVTVGRAALAVSPRMVPRIDFLAELGLQTADHAKVVGKHIPADPTGRTDIPGVWVAGNVTDPTAQIGAAASAGVTAAMQINADLVAEETRRAVAARRDPFSPESEARVCEAVLGHRRHGL